MIAEITFTPAQLYSVLGVLVFLGGGLLLSRKVFNYATTDELLKMETGIKAELTQIKLGIKEELEKQTLERHQMRHEVTRIEVALGKVETQVIGNTAKLTDINTKLEALPDKIISRLPVK